jgi:photosystem II stability/assembly factor-like uncharacterized protein
MTLNERRPPAGRQPDDGHDPFDDELRRALAHAAIEPAPERLVARVAAVPRAVRPGRTRFGRAGGWRRGWLGGGERPRMGFGLAAAAIVMLVAGVALLGRPVAGPSGGGPGPSGGVASSATSAETSGPSPTGSSTATATTSPPAGPAGGPVPAGFQPVSVTFASANAGWVLGAAPCAGGGCAAVIVRTTDGGRTWAGIPAPVSGIASSDSPQGPAAVRGLRFANALDGWAFGPGLFATHDGGATWRQIALPGATAESGVMALGTAAGVVHAAFLDATNVIRIATSPVGADTWTVSPTTMPVGAGPVPQAQFVLSGAAGWLIEIDRTVVGGARLAAGAWQAWQPPCLDANGPAALAATTELDLVAACDVGVWSTPTGIHVYASTDGGTTFAEAAAKPPVFNLNGVAVAGGPGSSAIVVAGSVSMIGAALFTSFDSGRTWASTYVLTGDVGAFADLGFTTTEQAVAITISATLTTGGVSEGHLVMTLDGGRTWSTVAIPGG